MAELDEIQFLRPNVKAQPLNLGAPRGGALVPISPASTAVVPISGSVPVGAARGSDRYNYEVAATQRQYSAYQPRATPPPERIPLNIPSAARPPIEFAEPPARVKLGLNLPLEPAAQAIDRAANNTLGNAGISFVSGAIKNYVYKSFDDGLDQATKDYKGSEAGKAFATALASGVKAALKIAAGGPQGGNQPEVYKDLGKALSQLPNLFNPSKWKDNPVDLSKPGANVEFPDLVQLHVYSTNNHRYVDFLIKSYSVRATQFDDPIFKYSIDLVIANIQPDGSVTYTPYPNAANVDPSTIQIQPAPGRQTAPPPISPPSYLPGGANNPIDDVAAKNYGNTIAPYLNVPVGSPSASAANPSLESTTNNLAQQMKDRLGNQQIMQNPGQLGLPTPTSNPTQPQLQPNPTKPLTQGAAKPMTDGNTQLFGSLPPWVFLGGAAASLLQPKVSTNPQPISNTFPKGTTAADPITGNSPYPKPDPEPDVERITEGNPTPESCSPCMIGLGRQQKATDEKVNNIGNLLQGLDLSVLGVINAKLGPQVEGGLSGFLGKFKDSFDKLTEWLHLDRALNVLTFLMTVQNAYFLCDSLKIVTLQMIANGLNVIGIHDKDGAAINLNKLFDDEIEGLLKKVLGAETLDGMKKEWKALNRIYQAGANIINAVQNMVFSVIGALEIIGSWNAQIGNALKKYGVIGSNAFGWLNTTPNFHNKFFTAVNNVLNIVNNIDFVSQSILSGRQAVDQITQQSEELTKGISESVGTKPPEHKPTAAAETAAKAHSSSPAPSAGDIQSI